MTEDLDEFNRKLVSICGQIGITGKDIANIGGIRGRHDARLGRLEQNLDLHETAEEPSQCNDPNA